MRPKFKSQSQIHKYIGFGYIGVFFCRNDSWSMKKHLHGKHSIPKWVLLNWLKIPLMPLKFSAQFACPSQKRGDFQKKLALDFHSPWSPLWSLFLKFAIIISIIIVLKLKFKWFANLLLGTIHNYSLFYFILFLIFL